MRWASRATAGVLRAAALATALLTILCSLPWSGVSAAAAPVPAAGSPVELILRLHPIPPEPDDRITPPDAPGTGDAPRLLQHDTTTSADRIRNQLDTLAVRLAPQIATLLDAAVVRPLLGGARVARDLSNGAAEARARLEHTVLLRLPAGADADRLAAALVALAEVESCRPNRLLSIPSSPSATGMEPIAAHDVAGASDDPRRDEQWYLDRVGVDAAWQITRGDASVLIAVIDTGISMHVDLQASIWTNDDPPGNGSTADDQVDQDGDGEVEDWERDDDDDNGFVDDTHGYDFVDAPRIGGPDDPLERDNDPSDGSGHGTMVAGLIGATADNAIGIAGLAPDCRLMPVRAGFNPGGAVFGGVLEEDDAAAAIIYAADNDAAVINMSWGDTLFSPLIADAVHYARERGVLLVGSAGNARSDAPHYPSGLAGVLSVGAIDDEGVAASFSNFGASLDLMAPGVELLTTVGTEAYVEPSGTSFAAPLVAAAAGLVRAHDPTLTSTEVAAVLTGSTHDIAPPGRDHQTGYGGLDAGRALRVERRASVRIVEPRPGDGADRQLTVRITAEGLGLLWYEVDWGMGREPLEFESIVRVEGRQAVEDSVGSWRTASLGAGDYTLRLRARDVQDGLLEERLVVRIDHTRPILRDEQSGPVWVDDHTEHLVFFETDDDARGRVLVREDLGGTILQRIDESFVTPHHTFRFPGDMLPDQVVLELTARNAAGLDAVSLELPAVLEERRARRHALTASAATFPAGEIGPDPVDLDQDGRPDLLLMEETPGTVYGETRIYEASGDDTYELEATLPVGLLPRGAADTDGDGLLEVVGIGAPVRGGIGTYLFESPSAGAYPTALTWADTVRAGFVIGIADLGGVSTILAIRGDSLVTYRSTGDASSWLRQLTPNASGYRSTLGTSFVAADLDGNGQTEIVIGDTAGRLLVWEDRAGVLEPRTWIQLPVEGTPHVTGGRLRGAGDEYEIVVRQELGIQFQSEALFDRRRHVIQLLRFEDGALRLQPGDGFEIAGIEQGANVLRVANIDADPALEILCVAAPDFYVFELGVAGYEESWTPTFHVTDIRTRGLAIGDIDGDGRREIVARRVTAASDRIVTFETRDTTQPGPLPPDGLEVRLVGATSAALSWNPGAPLYRIYRAAADSVDCAGATPIAEVDTPAYLDTLLADIELATYRVSAVAAGGMESACSLPITVAPGSAPWVTAVVARHARAVEVRFSQPMDATADRLENYALLEPGGEQLDLSSALPIEGDHNRLLTLVEPLPSAGAYRLQVGTVRSAAGVPLVTTGEVLFEVDDTLPPPAVLYLHDATVAGATIRLRLSAAPAPPLATTPESYTLEGGGGRRFVSADVEGADVILGLDAGRALASGTYRVHLAAGLVGVGGEVVMPGHGDAIEFSVAGVVAYPNPWDARRAAHSGVVFTGVQPGVEVVVLDALGREVTRVQADGSGRATLPIAGNPSLASGIYLYRVETGSEIALGKLAIIK